MLDHLEDPTNPANTLFEQCDVGPAGGYVMDPRLPTPGPLRCADFFSSYRNQVLGQDYAGATPQHRMAGGHVRCGTNCLYDLSECTFAAREPGFSDTGTVPGVQLYEAWQQSTTALSTQWFDEHGNIVGKFAPIDISPVPGSFPDGRPVDLTALGPSSHPMFAFFQRLYRYRPDGWAGAPPDWAFQHYHEVWELTLGMDAADFGGTPGELRIIRSFGLEFEVDYPANTGRLVSVNGVPFDASAPYVNATAPGIFVGGSTATTTLWDGNRPPQPATGPLADRGPGVPSAWRLGLDFTALNVGWIGDWQCANPALYCPRFGEGGPGAVAFYARHELLDGGFEAPQYGDLRALMPGIDEATVEYFHRSLYNPALKRYDSSDHTMRMLGEDSWNGTWNPDTPQLAPESEWERLATTLCRRYGVNVTQWAKPVRESAAQVEPDVPADCGNVVFNDFDANRTVEFNSQTEVFFLLDRSESMAQVDAGDFGISRSRLDHAKLAAREFFNGLTMGLGASEAGPRVGLLYYNDDRIVATPTEPSCSASGTCSEGTCESGECIALCTEATAETDCASGVCFEGHCLGTLRYSNTEITRGRFEDFTVPRGDAVAAEYPTPEGYTYTSGAIRAASRLFGGAAPGGNDTTKVIVDVTDGIPTLPHFPGPRPAFLSAIDEVEAGGNMHYWSLLVHYPAFDAASYASIDVAERKFVGMRPEGEDTPPLLFQAYANLRGAGLARSHLEPPSMYVPDTGIQSYLDGVEYDALVETGTSRLVFAVSDFDDEPDGVATVRLRDPSGEEYSMSTAGPGHQITVDPRASVLWAVPNPQPGRWLLLDHNHGSVLPTKQKVYVSALVESQQNLPQCKAYPRKKVYQDGDTVVIRAEAVYERPIETGASFEGLLMRPDGIVSKLEFEWSWVSRAFEARVEPGELCGRGQYLAWVQCAVAEGSHTVQGERSGQPQDQLTDDSLVAPAFERQTSTGFYVDSIDTCPLPGTNAGEQDPTIYTDRGLFSDGFWYMDPFLGDADGDGIPNQNEPADDLDGDGVEDARDPDANNNEVPDAVDPEIPYGPASDGAGDGCSPWNANACCSSIGACVGAISQLAIYAEGQLVLQNGTQVLSDTGFAAVLNNGGTETHLAADVDVGTIWSHPGVFGGERAEVHGDLRTGGTLYPPQNDVEVAGDLQQGFSFEFPTLEGFAPSVTPGGTNPIVNSGQSRTLPPGAYGAVTVNSYGTLYLSSGRYDLRSLQLGASSVAVLDLSAGPIYLYVTDSVMFQATTVVTGGSPTDLFLGYMGSGMVAVERAFTGTIVAPHGSIRLAPLNGPGEYVGSFFAKNVSVEASGNVVRLAPFGHPWLPTSQSDDCSNGVRDGSETDIDCGGSCASGCSLGQGCTVDGDCAQGACISGVCTEPPSGCSEAVAVDLGAPGQSWVVPNDGCVMVRNGFPSWWGTRNLQLQSQDGGNYPVPFAWSQSCTGKAGSGAYTGNWQSKVFGPVSSSCAVLIDLQGSGGSIALRYHAN